MTVPVVEELMSAPIVSVSPGMLAADALDLARQHRLHHLPVVDRGSAIGMVCTCDLEQAQVSASVSSSMHCPPASTQPNISGTDALDLMNSRRVGSLLVLDGDRLVGIVTRRDIEASGIPVRNDPRGYCSCCGGIAHLRPHATGSLCSECLARSRPEAPVEHGGGD